MCSAAGRRCAMPTSPRLLLSFSSAHATAETYNYRGCRVIWWVAADVCLRAPFPRHPRGGGCFPKTHPLTGSYVSYARGRRIHCARENRNLPAPTPRRVCKSCLLWDVLSRLRDRTRGLLGCTRGCWSSEAFCPRVAVPVGYQVQDS